MPIYGVVVEADCRRSHGTIRAYVIDLHFLQDTGLPMTRAVHEQAFRPPVDRLDRNLEDADWKHLERKYGKPLAFGDVISWEPDDMMEDGERRGMEVICRFHRLTNGSLQLFRTRIHNGHGQVLLEGIINPNDPRHLYTDYFRQIRIPPQYQNNAWPNIYYHVWIYLLADEYGDLEIRFGEFSSVCDPGKQLDVACVPWNKESDKYNIIMYESNSEDDEFNGLAHATSQRNHKDHPAMEIWGKEATLTGYRTMIIWDLPQYKTVLPFRTMNLQPGRMFCIDAIWNSYEKMYMVSKVLPSHRDESIMPSNDQGLLRISVRENALMKGVFENETFGLMDDPKGVLSLLHLSKFAKNAIPVYISDAHPSRGAQFRFRIEDVHGDKKRKLEELKQSGLEIENCAGLVLDQDWAFAGEHSPLFFRFAPIDRVPEPGTRIKFSAVYNAEKKEFLICEWREDPSKPALKAARLRMNPSNADEEQFVFCVTGKPPNHSKKLTKMIYTDEFGLVDDNLEKIAFDPKAPAGKSYTIWVTRVIHGPDDPHQARTVFHIVGLRDDIPPHRIDPTLSEQSQEDIDLQQAFQAIMRESRVERVPSPGDNESSVSNTHSNRFTAPTPSRDVVSPVEKPTSPRSSASSRGLFSQSNDDDHQSIASTYRTPHVDTTLNWTDDNQSVASLRSEPARPAPSSGGLFKSRPASAVLGKEGFSFLSSDIGNLRVATDVLEDDSASCDGSLRTADGGIYPSSSKVVEPYDGPVLMTEPGAKTQYDVVETLSRIKHNFTHTKCGLSCTQMCPWLVTIADLIVRHDDFWKEVQEYHPAIAETLVKAMHIY